MAEEEKAVKDEPVSEDELGNGVAKSPEKRVNGSVKEEPEAGVSESAGRESESEEVQLNGHDSLEEAEQDGEAVEGSMFVALGVKHSSFDFRAHGCQKVEDATFKDVDDLLCHTLKSSVL